MEFHGRDLQTLEGALRVAAEEYRKHAKQDSNPRIIAQFNLQATACDRLLMRIADEGEDD